MSTLTLLRRNAIAARGLASLSNSLPIRPVRHIYTSSNVASSTSDAPSTAIPASSSHSSVSNPIRLISGIQPSGIMHLGNYLGAVSSWVELQNGTFHHVPTSTTTGEVTNTKPLVTHGQSVDLNIFLADWHAMTVTPNPLELEAKRLGMTAQLLACGLDPNRSTIFIQSHVREHLELCWIFFCLTPYMQLTRMTQFKQKSKDMAGRPGDPKAKSASVALFSYPILQAADILLYQAEGVPVGEDQFQHIELCRDVATLYNNEYASDSIRSAAVGSNRPPPFAFPLPQHLATPTARVMNLRDGTKKMSKSEISDATRINLTDDADLIAKKIKAAKTDSIDHITFDKVARPELANLLTILSSVTHRSIDEIVRDPALSTKQQVKLALTDALVQLLRPIRNEYHRLEKDELYLKSVLKDGAQRARKIAEGTMKQVKENLKVGEY